MLTVFHARHLRLLCLLRFRLLGLYRLFRLNLLRLFRLDWCGCLLGGFADHALEVIELVAEAEVWIGRNMAVVVDVVEQDGLGASVVRRDPDQQDAEREASKDPPADEGQVKYKQAAFLAFCHRPALFDRADGSLILLSDQDIDGHADSVQNIDTGNEQGDF